MNNRDSAKNIVACLVDFLAQKHDSDTISTTESQKRTAEAKEKLVLAIEATLDSIASGK
jgi:hypothetical protein